MTESRHKQIDIILKIIGVIIAIFGIVNYYDGIQKSRLDRTLNIYSSYHQPPVHSARMELVNVSRELFNQWISLPRSDRPDADERRALMTKELSKNGMKNNIDVVAEYYELTLQCVIRNGCNKDISLSLFKEEAREIFSAAKYRIIEARKSDKNYARAVECFARQNIDSDFCED